MSAAGMAGPEQPLARLPFLATAMLAAGLLFGLGCARAEENPALASPVGLWQTISDVDGKPKAYVRIREENGTYSGVIEDIIDPVKRAERCEKCPGARQNQPVLGMTILTGLHRDGDHFGGGDILDPDNGRVYSCKITLADGGRHLEVRGYFGISLLGRTQTWNRKE
jgi:uncharacterized protein (DUF2147 family)